jgi:hypothetical protein
MIALDPQIARAEIILAANRPAPEPTEHELRQILDHITVNPEPKAETAEAAR